MIVTMAETVQAEPVLNHEADPGLSAARSRPLAKTLPLPQFMTLQLSQDTRPTAAEHSQSSDEMREIAQFFAGQDPVMLEAAFWLVRCEDGLPAKEQTEFEAWLSADPAHGDLLDDLRGTWSRVGAIPKEQVAGLRTRAPRPSPAISRLLESPTEVMATRKADRTQGHGWFDFLDFGRLVPRLATAGIALATLGAGWLGWESWQAQPLYQQHVATVRGTQQRLTLPDGSIVVFDTATRADIVLYRNRREVRLSQGQAHFNVQPDADRPFQVVAGTAEVTVVGTRFTVRRTSTGVLDHGVGVAVEEGRVRVAQLNGTGNRSHAIPLDSVVLAAGQAAAVDDGGRITRLADHALDVEGAWRNGRVSFSGVTLAQALEEFERYGDTRIVISDPGVAHLRVHGSFDLHRLDAFLKALPKVLPVLVKSENGQAVIVPAS